MRLQCVHGQKNTLYIPVVKVRLQYQPTVCPWTKNCIYYTWGEGENTVRTIYYASMEQKLLV